MAAYIGACWVVQGRKLYRPSAGSLVSNPKTGEGIQSYTWRLESPRGDLKRELVEEIRQKGKPETGRQRKKLRKALARGGDV